MLRAGVDKDSNELANNILAAVGSEWEIQELNKIERELDKERRYRALYSHE